MLTANSGMKFCRRSNRRLLLLFGIFLLSIILYLSIYSESLEDSKINKELFIDNEINSILQTTPYLFRRFSFKENETVSSRLESQKLWIQRLSKTDYIKTAPKKKILVQDGIDEYYHTQGLVQCPYAPEFQDKCDIVEEKWYDIGPWKYNGIDAVVGVRNIDDHSKLFGEPKAPNHVKHILYILEPPHIAKNADLGKTNALIATYSKGSDIPIPYRQWIPNGSKDISTQTSRDLDIIISGKTKMVAVMISNCESLNNRLGFVHELQKYVDVDVFGKCGNFSCPKGQHEDCMSMLRKNYKFYFSIENSNCVDYITEKFFDNALKNDLVPIVMGANPNTYKLESPPHSYIHVNDYESPKALAEYLHLLNNNETMYKSYFKWKVTGRIESREHLQDFFCRLCGMLYYADFVPMPTWNSSAMTWRDVNYCLPKGQWYWK